MDVCFLNSCPNSNFKNVMKKPELKFINCLKNCATVKYCSSNCRDNDSDSH